MLVTKMSSELMFIPKVDLSYRRLIKTPFDRERLKYFHHTTLQGPYRLSSFKVAPVIKIFSKKDKNRLKKEQHLLNLFASICSHFDLDVEDRDINAFANLLILIHTLSFMGDSCIKKRSKFFIQSGSKMS